MLTLGHKAFYAEEEANTIQVVIQRGKCQHKPKHHNRQLQGYIQETQVTGWLLDTKPSTLRKKPTQFSWWCRGESANTNRNITTGRGTFRKHRTALHHHPKLPTHWNSIPPKKISLIKHFRSCSQSHTLVTTIYTQTLTIHTHSHTQILIAHAHGWLPYCKDIYCISSTWTNQYDMRRTGFHSRCRHPL